MNIKGVSNNGKLYPLPDQKKKQDVQNETEKKADKLEISNEARALQNSVHDVSEIQRKIDQKFYDSDEVISATVSAILKEFGLE